MIEPQLPVDPVPEIVDERPHYREAEAVKPWAPSAELLQEHEWVKEWLAQPWYFNPMPAIRESYQSRGVVWWLMIAGYLGFAFGFWR